MITPGARHWSEDGHPWSTEHGARYWSEDNHPLEHGARHWSEDDHPWTQSTTLVTTGDDHSPNHVDGQGHTITNWRWPLLKQPDYKTISPQNNINPQSF